MFAPRGRGVPAWKPSAWVARVDLPGIAETCAREARQPVWPPVLLVEQSADPQPLARACHRFVRHRLWAEHRLIRRLKRAQPPALRPRIRSDETHRGGSPFQPAAWVGSGGSILATQGGAAVLVGLSLFSRARTGRQLGDALASASSAARQATLWA